MTLLLSGGNHTIVNASRGVCNAQNLDGHDALCRLQSRLQSLSMTSACVAGYEDAENVRSHRMGGDSEALLD